MNNNIKILIADDHQLIREGIEAMIRDMPDMEVVGMADSGEEAIDMIKSVKPNVILMDIVNPGMNGIESARRIKATDKQIKLIFITMDVSKAFVSEGIKAGVDGYLPKDTSKRTLMDAIRSVNAGDRYFNDAIKKLVFDDYYLTEKTRGVVKPCSDHLTKREIEVLALVASGKSNKQIGEMLFISIKTVETHKTNILTKLDLSNSAELVRYAIKTKIISID